jgi:hypothetical protein
LDGGFVEVRRYRKRTSRHPLASSAMTNPGQIRLPYDAITNVSAKATTFMYYCHFTTASKPDEG